MDRLSVAELVRKAIARELAGDEQSWRWQALERGLGLEVPVPEDPADLVRELAAKYDAAARVSRAPATGG